MRLAVLTVAAAFLAGCSMNARLYDLDTGEVLHPTFKYSGSGKGRLSLPQEDGSVCSGEYVTVAQGTTSWGTIFGSVYGASGAAGVSATTYSVNVEGKQKGTAIMTCPDGRIVECEYVTSSYSVQGYGACLDNHGKRYRLMF